MSLAKNMSLFRFRMRSNQERHTTHIYLAAHVVAEKPLALASWRVHLTVQKAQRLFHVANANPVKI
jgi:hypothetical protein